ncbi:MAG TPA: hypothetical protein DGG95_16095 [Cytophagales bacterium]|nr:hypothetical protein [Cytophagales bacterium]
MESKPTGPSSFIEAFNDFVFYGVIASFALVFIIYFFYTLRVSLIKDPKEKYDFINLNEIKWYKRVFFFIGLTIAFIINLYGTEKVLTIDLLFFVRGFFSIACATLVGYVSALILEFYYPTKLNLKLRKLRYTPRINPKNGHKMRLLREDEEDVHLNEGMQAAENIFSIDYDVWVDESTSDVKIEKYQGHLIALQCKNCGFYTMKVFMEEIIERNEDGTPRELLKHYQCSYCKNVRATQFTVSKKETEDYKLQKPKLKRNTGNIDAVKIDLHSTLGARKSYEFKSIEELEKFLKEFDFDKVS